MVISKRQRLFGKGYTGGSWDAGKNLFLYPGGSLISLCITIVFHALCFNCDVSSQHKAGCSQRWKRNAELCECKVSTVKSQLRPKQPWSFGFNLLARVVLAPPSKPRPESFELLGTAGLRAEQSGVGRSLEF